VIFIDYVLPPGNGLEALDILRDHAVNHECAAILVTGDDRSDVAVCALKRGCADYIAKGKLSAGTLRRCVIRALHGADCGFSPETRMEPALARHAEALAVPDQRRRSSPP
jgi:PleD family two-component response regulator